MKLWREFISSVQFLSRFPVHRLPAILQADHTPDFAKSARMFPFAGALIATPAAAVLALTLLLELTPLIASVLAVITLVFCTGALHEDGLADVADGFWGGFTKERKLEIMRDSAIGTYGVLALVLCLLLKVALLTSLSTVLQPIPCAMVLIAVAAVSRTAVLYPWFALPPARPKIDGNDNGGGKAASGLSARYGRPDFQTYLVGGVLSLPFAAILWWATGLWPIVIAIITVKVLVLGFTHLSKRHVGGHTGDILGATQQISEIALLLGLTIAM